MPQTANEKNFNVFSELIKTLVAVIEQKDDFIRGHADRVSSECVHFARTLKLPKQIVDKIYLAGLLHDIGMVCLPLEIVQKPEPLTDEEKKLIQGHPVIAENVLSHMSILQGVLGIIRYHHEAFDGSGYPEGLKGDEIPLESRIIAVVDSYCAMTSPRPQRPALSRDDALAEIQKGAGTQYDDRVVKLFFELMQGVEEETGAVAAAKKKKQPETIQEAVTYIIKKVKDGEIDLPVLPKVIQEIENVMKQPNSSIDDLAEVIERDAVVSVRLISVANSAVYRGADKIATVKQAVPRLGMQETRNTISAIATKSIYKTSDAQGMIVMEKLWMHALATAYSSRAIAEKTGLGEYEKYFLMGLIHDIGKVLLVKMLPEVLPNEKLDMQNMLDGIQEVHAAFGATLLEEWGFTPEYVKVAEAHDGHKFSEATKKGVLVVNLANSMTRTMGYSVIADEELQASTLESAKLLGLEAEDLNGIKEQVMELMQTTANIF